MSNLKRLVALAWKNVKTYAWMNVKMCFTFACLAFLVCLFTVYNFALNERREELIRGSVSANYAYCESEIGAELSDMGATIASENTILAYDYSEATASLYGKGSKIITSSFVTLQVSGTTFNAYEDESLGAYAAEGETFFHEYDLIELKQNFRLESFLSAGNMPVSKNELLIGEPVLNAYGLKAEDVLGKEITASLKNLLPFGNPRTLFTARVTGIICEEYYSLMGHDLLGLRPALLFHAESDLFAANAVEYFLYHLENWPEEDTAVAWQEHFANFDYVGASLVDWIDSLNNVQVLASNLYIIIGSSLLVGLVLTIFLMIDKYIKVFSRSGGILLTHGMRRGHLYILLLIQLLILCLIAIPIALVLTAAGYSIINFLVEWATHVSMGLSIARILGMLAIGIASVVAIALLFFVYAALFKLRRRTVKEFLTVEID